MDGISQTVASTNELPLPALQPIKQPSTTALPVAEKRVELNYDKAVGVVVFKVIDAASDTVIREYPSAEVQALHRRLSQVLGLLVDTRI